MQKLRKILSFYCLALLITMLVTGCGRHDPYVLTAQSQFDNSAPDAIIVMGVKSAQPDRDLLFANYRMVTTLWEQLKLKGDTRDVPAVKLSPRTPLFANRTYTGDADAMAWFVRRVPAGSYMLREISTSDGKDHYITRLSQNTGNPFFAVKPGEVRYIGDLHFDVMQFPAKLVKLTRNDAMARQALAQHAGIKVAPFFRAPAVLPKDSNTPVVLKVSD